MLDLCGWVVVRRLCQSKEILKKCKEIQNLKSKNPHKCWIFVGEVLLQGRARARNATVSQIPRLNTGCHSADIRERWANTKTSKSANTSTKSKFASLWKWSKTDYDGDDDDDIDDGEEGMIIS